MDIFRQLISYLANTPDWVPLILVPALALAAAVLLVLAGGKKAYAPLAAALGGAGFALMCCTGTLAEAFVWAGMYSALALLARLLFLLPRRKKGERRTPRDERIYRRFCGEPLSAEPCGAAPVKECCFEEEAPCEAPPELDHALSLLEKLQGEKLTAADRLEAAELARTVSALRGRTLTPAQQLTLNDSLACVLKMAAKYKL